MEKREPPIPDQPSDEKNDSENVENEPINESRFEEIQFVDGTGPNKPNDVAEAGKPEVPPITILDETADEQSDAIPLASEVLQIRDIDRARTIAESRRFNPYIYAATGGAFGSIALGVFSILGAFVSSASALTGLFGIALGIWGLTSKFLWWSVAGLALSMIGFVLSIVLAQLGLTIIEIMTQTPGS